MIANQSPAALAARNPEAVRIGPAPPHAAPWRREQLFAAIVTTVFIAVVIPVMLHHEMWRDEMQAWLLARDTSLVGLFHALRYEAHPSLWYLLLRVVGQLTGNPAAMQWLCVALGATSVYLFALLAPLPRVVRVLFAFSYFVAYGYTVVARSYSLEMLLVIALCAVTASARLRRSPVLRGVALLLLANVTIYGVILVLALIGATVLIALFGGERDKAQARGVSTQRDAPQSAGRRLRPALVPITIGLIGVGLALAQVWPAADAPYRGNGLVTAVATTEWAQQSTLAYRLTPMWRAFVPIPPMDGDLGSIWEGDMLLHRSPRAEPIAASLSILIVLVLTATLGRSPLAATFFVLATLGTLLFSLLIYTGALYHHGHFFLAFIIALWLGAADPRWHEPGPRLPRGIAWVCAHRIALIVAMLLIQVAGAAIRLVDDYAYPFSEGEAVAAYLRAHTTARTALVTYPGFKGTTVSGYLGRPLFELDRARMATFTPLWVPATVLDDSHVLASVRACCVHLAAPAVLIVDHALTPASSPPAILASFTRSIQPSEHYYIYEVGPR